MSEHSNGRRAPVGAIRSGLVLGGGGARGLAHVGVIQVLEREGYPIDLISGTSMGGLVAVLYGVLGNGAALEAIAERRAENRPDRLSRGPRPEVYESRGFRRWLGNLVGERTFADLHWPVGVTAVDIDSGEEIVLNRGPVAPAMWATSALPGFYAPVVVNGRRLVDGGVLNPLPVDVALRMGAAFTLAVDVLPETDLPAPRLGAGYHRAMLGKVGVTMGAVSKAFDLAIGAIRDHRLALAPPDLLIIPDLRGYSTVAYHSSAEIIARGAEAAEAVVPEIRRLRDRVLEARAMPVGHR